MLKKHNKLILLLVLATFMLSIVGSASAATFSDVTTDKAAADIYKLNALGIIQGYPDGTFKPENTITRAEFAKIAVCAAGLEDVASGMANVPAVFSDVPANEWYNGWVSVAAAQGFVKGYPGGTFAPNATITQAEVITVFLRLLGYNDNLPGDWPSDYISKAANLEVLKNITFVANKAATRAEVASMGSETLSKYVVEYQADANTFENAQKVDADDLDRDNDKKELVTYTLMEDKFAGGLTEDALVTKLTVPDQDGGNYKLEYYLTDEDGNFTTATPYSVTVADNFVVGNAKSILDCNLKFVDFIANDDDDAIYISVNNYGIVKDTEITTKDVRNGLAARVEIADKDYDFAPDVFWNPTANGVPYLQKVAAKNDAADTYTGILNEDGDIAVMAVSTQPSPGIVDYVNADRETVSFKNNPEGCLTSLGTTYSNKLSSLADKKYFVVKDGVPATLKDIAANDSVVVLSGQDNYAEGGYAGVDYYIVAVSEKNSRITGKLEAVEANADGTLKKVTVDGKEYKVVNSTDYSADRTELSNGTLLSAVSVAPVKVKPLVSVDSADSFEIITDSDYISGGNYDLMDKTVTLLMTSNGKVGTIISDVDNADTGKIWGVLIQKVAQTTKGSELVSMIKMVNKDDQEVSYAINDDTTLNGVDKTVSEIYNAIALGDMVAITLTGDGDIDNVKTTDIKTTTVAGAANVDDDLDSIKLTVNGITGWYTAKDAVVFNYKSPAAGADADADIMTWSDIQDTIASGTALTFDYYIDGNEVKYIATADAALNTDNNYAIFVKTGKDSTDPYAVILKDGKEAKFYLNNEASYTNAKGYKKGNLMEFKWEGSDMKVIAKATLKSAIIGGGYDEVTDVKVKSNIVEIGGVAYLVDEDTLVFDATNHDALKQLTLEDVARGDDVYAIYDKDNKVLAAIVITDADDAVDMGISAVNAASSVAVSGVTVSPATLALTVGGATGTVAATVAPATATNKTVTWTSSNTAVATVANGVVTPVAAGTANITATTADGSKTAVCAVTVTAGAVNPTFAATVAGTSTIIAAAAEVTITTPMAGATYYTATGTNGVASAVTAVTAKAGVWCAAGGTVTVKFYSDAAGTTLVGQGTVVR